MSGLRRATEGGSRTHRLLTVGAVLVTLLIAVIIWLQRPAPTAQATPRPTPSTVTPSPSPFPSPSPASGPCSSPATHEFTPTSITVPGVVNKARVLALPRDSQDLPSTPPETVAGKQQFAWDRPPGIKPGGRMGNVLLNTHTWPDGMAMGNRLLKGLHVGGRIVVRGGHDTLCYRVERRIELPASKLVPTYYDRVGPPQLAIVVCSGRRLGPGNWTARTFWYASPVPDTSRS